MLKMFKKKNLIHYKFQDKKKFTTQRRLNIKNKIKLKIAFTST